MPGPLPSYTLQVHGCMLPDLPCDCLRDHRVILGSERGSRSPCQQGQRSPTPKPLLEYITGERVAYLPFLDRIFHEVNTIVTPAAQRMQQAKSTALSVFLRLLSEAELLEQVPPVLARLLESSVKLQKAALDADAVRHLAVLLSKPGRPLGPAPSSAVSGTRTASASASARHPSQPPPSAPGSSAGSSPLEAGCSPLPPGTRPSLQEGVLRALSSLCMDQRDGRKQPGGAKCGSGRLAQHNSLSFFLFYTYYDIQEKTR